MLDQCNRLADLCAGGDEADRQFDQAFEQLRTLARAHFEVEAALLAERDEAALEDHAAECEEFDYEAYKANGFQVVNPREAKLGPEPEALAF